MSMDDQLEQLQYFSQSLETFNTHLKASVRDLEDKHYYINSVWQDSFRKKYDAEWSTFHAAMQHYMNYEAPQYAQFLHRKIIELRRYLFGE